MKFISRPAALALAFVAALALAYGCQIRDAGVPTEVDRTLEGTDHTPEHTIIQLIDELFDPALGKSVKKSFNSIVADLKKNKTAVAQAKTRTLIDFILKHYADDKLLAAATSTKVGNLNLKLLQYAGLLPNVQDAAGAACLPGDPECEAFPEEGKAHVPGDLITQPFNILVYEVDCSTLGEGVNAIPPCYEVDTYPPQTFAPSTSSSTSLSLSQFDTPVVGVCVDVPDEFDAGIDVLLYHSHDGVIEQTQFEPLFNACDDELGSRWANPLLARFQPVLEMLGPQPLYAAGIGSVSGAISNFSTLFACLPGCLPTTTTIQVLNGTTPDNSFVDGEEITIKMTVTPAPLNDEDPRGLFVIRRPCAGCGIAHLDQVEIEDGMATWSVTCGEEVPFFSDLLAFANFYGTTAHETSLSATSSFTCSAN